ncbi:DNA cytosine methyltransferase [Streptomyces achmelvichensis]|uniref:DNA cytosine methyltransferase n=1 Tax=Streptomyces achmelvichensis TaxID=3134111 RepID=UPI003C12C222
MRFLHALNTVGEPDWVAMEEVPDVLPLWKQYAAVLRGWGFSVWYGILNAGDFRVPQTRKRAILLASRVRTAQPPTPTQSQFAEPESLFGPGAPAGSAWPRPWDGARPTGPSPPSARAVDPNRSHRAPARRCPTPASAAPGCPGRTEWSCSPAAKAPDGRPGTAHARTGPPTLRRQRSPPRRTAGPGPCTATTRQTPLSVHCPSRLARCSSGTAARRSALGSPSPPHRRPWKSTRQRIPSRSGSPPARCGAGPARPRTTPRAPFCGAPRTYGPGPGSTAPR